MSSIWYSISVSYYYGRGIKDFSTRHKARKDKAVELADSGLRVKKFTTEKAGLSALVKAGLSVSDFDVCETTSL